jgi:hypothetical protein
MSKSEWIYQQQDEQRRLSRRRCVSPSEKGSVPRKNLKRIKAALNNKERKLLTQLRNFISNSETRRTCVSSSTLIM